MIDPAVPGAVAVIVNEGPPLLVFAAMPLLRVTAQLSSAPAVDGNVPQLTVLMPLTAVTAVATTPVGNCSLIVADVPDVLPPLLPRVKV